MHPDNLSVPVFEVWMSSYRARLVQIGNGDVTICCQMQIHNHHQDIICGLMGHTRIVVSMVDNVAVIIFQQIDGIVTFNGNKVKNGDIIRLAPSRARYDLTIRRNSKAIEFNIIFNYPERYHCATDVKSREQMAEA